MSVLVAEHRSRVTASLAERARWVRCPLMAEQTASRAARRAHLRPLLMSATLAGRRFRHTVRSADRSAARMQWAACLTRAAQRGWAAQRQRPAWHRRQVPTVVVPAIDTDRE